MNAAASRLMAARQRQRVEVSFVPSCAAISGVDVKHVELHAGWHTNQGPVAVMPHVHCVFEAMLGQRFLVRAARKDRERRAFKADATGRVCLIALRRNVFQVGHGRISGSEGVIGGAFGLFGHATAPLFGPVVGFDSRADTLLVSMVRFGSG